MTATRTARAEDASEAIALLRRSITELCVVDHQHDKATLDAWLANKRIERFERWRNDPHCHLIVAEVDGAIRGVGSIRDSGDLSLCYALPGFQGIGIGRALITELEAQAARWQLARIYLASSTKAQTFYERHGYRSAGPALPGFGITFCHPYEKLMQHGAREVL